MCLPKCRGAEVRNENTGPHCSFSPLQLLNWVLEHMGDSPKKTSLQGVLSAGKTKVSFLPYDWGTNSSH